MYRCITIFTNSSVGTLGGMLCVKDSIVATHRPPCVQDMCFHRIYSFYLIYQVFNIASRFLDTHYIVYYTALYCICTMHIYCCIILFSFHRAYILVYCYTALYCFCTMLMQTVKYYRYSLHYAWILVHSMSNSCLYYIFF